MLLIYDTFFSWNIYYYHQLVILDAQASLVTTEATGLEASSEWESLDDDDVKRNADLYIFNHEVAQI